MSFQDVMTEHFYVLVDRQGILEQLAKTLGILHSEGFKSNRMGHLLPVHQRFLSKLIQLMEMSVSESKCFKKTFGDNKATHLFNEVASSEKEPSF